MKITIIAGKGKKKEVKKIASKYQESDIEVKCLDGLGIDNNPYYFDSCTKKTKLIIFKGASDEIELYLFSLLASNGVLVNSKGKEAFLIYPNIILTCKKTITENTINRFSAKWNMTNKDLLEIIKL